MAIAYVGSADLGNNGGSGTFTGAYTVGAGANRLLVVCFEGDVSGGADDITGVTYNGVSMTLVDKRDAGGAGRITYLYFLLGPASGTHNVVITSTASHMLIPVAADYSGVKQTSQPDNSTTNSTTYESNLTTVLTTIADNCWTILGSISLLSQSAGAGSTRRVEGATYDEPDIFDSNGVITPAGSYSMRTDASTFLVHIMASFAPAGAGGGGAPVLSSITPASAYANDDADVTLTGVTLIGTDMDGASPVVNVPAGWTASSLVVGGPTSATFDLTIPAGETPGPYSITFETVAGESDPITFTISDPAGSGGAGGSVFASSIFGGN